MTEVAFHFNAPDKLAYTCRLLKKAFSQSAQVVVSADPSTIEQLDQALWTFRADAFVPHCTVQSQPMLWRHSPVVLVPSSELPDTLTHHKVLVNLGQELVKGFEAFERVIEVVTLNEEDRLQARQRWKHYATRGYPLKRHDLALVVN